MKPDRSHITSIRINYARPTAFEAFEFEIEGTFGTVLVDAKIEPLEHLTLRSSASVAFTSPAGIGPATQTAVDRCLAALVAPIAFMNADEPKPLSAEEAARAAIDENPHCDDHDFFVQELRRRTEYRHDLGYVANVVARALSCRRRGVAFDGRYLAPFVEREAA